jgi:PEP-CTERM motif
VQHLLSILFTADAQGAVSFNPSFDATPNHDVLLYGEDNIIDVDDIQFIGTRLTIVPEPASIVMALMSAAALGAVAIRKRRVSSARN